MYSIEFDTLGQLEDVERRIPWKTVPAATQVQITTELDSLYRRYRLIKVQEQWTGARASLLALCRGEEPPGPYETRYEIVLKGKTENMQWYEYLFNEDGQVERVSRIVFRNTDNLDF